MGKKVFIARDKSGLCLIMSKKPVFRDGTYFSSGGSVADFHPTVAALLGIPFPAPGEMIEWPTPAQTKVPESEPPEIKKDCSTCRWGYAVNFRDPENCPCVDFSNWELGTGNWGQREEAAETSKTEPEPPAEKLVPITGVEQLTAGDVLKNKAGSTVEVEGIIGRAIIGIASEGDDLPCGMVWSIQELQAAGFKQVITAPRTLNNSEALGAIYDGKTVKHVAGRVTYMLSEDKARVMVTREGPPVLSVAVYVETFDLPKGRYEIVIGGE